MANSKVRPRSCFRFRVMARSLELSIAIGKVVLLPGGASVRPAAARSDIGAGLRHQQGRVRPLIDLPEIEHDDAGEFDLRTRTMCEHRPEDLRRRQTRCTPDYLLMSAPEELYRLHMAEVVQGVGQPRRKPQG
jgi:hypothetical protein